jgi:hypothetical protein
VKERKRERQTKTQIDIITDKIRIVKERKREKQRETDRETDRHYFRRRG